mgnify:CR=1 FL=1
MIIDFHTHIFPPSISDNRHDLLQRDETLAAMYSDTKSRMASAEELVATMDGASIDISVALGIGWNDPDLCRQANDYMIASVRKFPLRLRGFCSINPLWGRAAIDEVERCVEAGLVGIGELHPDTQGYDLGDRNTMEHLAETAVRLNIPILTHTSEPIGHTYPGKGRTTPDVVYRFIENFPEVTLICAHWGGGLPFYALMPEVAVSMRNVYFDSAASPYLYSSEVFSVMSNLIEEEKVLLGTDYPLMKQNLMIQQIVDGPMSDHWKESIFYNNAARLLGMPAWNEYESS